MWAVAKREYISFFKTSLGYFLLAVYGLLSAILFSYFVLWNNTSYLGEYFGFYLIFVDIAIIAVMSMKMFSEDKKLKTEQLLLTSPVSVTKLVLGKFIGAYLIFWTATAINIIYVIIIEIFGNLDHGALFTNFIGMLLLSSSMIAIAVLISSLTENPLSTAATSIAVLFGLMMIGFFSAFIPVPWLADVISKLTLYAYYNPFTQGIIDFIPIVYYISVTAIMIFLTIRVIEKRRWS